ncbi:MAG: AraC family transcriptional regulator [Rubrivivax sp.]|nr:AraC family transcriptional regulator [Rubrivivax sp.]
MSPTAAPQLLDAYPLVRSRSVADASERIGRIFSRHQLALRGGELDVRHNQLRLNEVSLNVLRYGAEVSIDPGERGDFYLVQLPLAGSAELASGGQRVHVDPGVLSVLQPQARSHMVWSGDCTMLLVQVPRQVVDRRAAGMGSGAAPRFALTRSRRDPAVAAWWQAVLDLTHNLDQFGPQWLGQPAAAAAMSEFLLGAFTSMLCEPSAAPAEAITAPRADARCLQRAKDFVHAHTDRALSLAEIARHACVGPRTLEAVFQRHGEGSPMAYARHWRLQAAHRALQAAARDGRPVSVTDVALAHGFLHMGRFAAQYRAAFGCAPSHTLRWH